MANYIYKGYGVTDSNGIAKLEYDENGDALTHSYTGVGAGEVDFIASTDAPADISDSSFQSETYEVLDCLFYDEATSSSTKNSNWTASNVSVSYSDGHTVLSKTSSSSNGNYTMGVQVNTPSVIEFTNHIQQENNNYVLVGTAYSHIGFATANSIVKIVIDETKFTIYVDDDMKQQRNLNESLSNGLNFVLRMHSNSQTNIEYSNLKFYPI